MNFLLDASRRALGLLLIALVVMPVYGILDPSAPQGSLEALMRQAGADSWGRAWGLDRGPWGVLVVAVGAGLAFFSEGRLTAWFAQVGAIVSRPPSWVAATVAGLVGAGITAWVAIDILDGRAALNDAGVQLLQARYLAAGHFAAPPLSSPEFWSIQFMVHTSAGWVSQYPPFHAMVLAAGFFAGTPWIAMAAIMGVLGVFLSLSLDRLLPGRTALTRAATLIAVANPMSVTLAASYMNHMTVAALAAVALYCALRAEGGKSPWALGAGLAMGAMVTTRPVSGLLIGATVTVGLWAGPLLSQRKEWRSHLFGSAGRRLGFWVLGGLPFALWLGWHNARFFGSPFTFGYTAASGPSHGLGFHEDPWGRMYGFTEALGYSATELLTLGEAVLGTSLPVAAFVGVFLVAAQRLDRGERLILAWATLPILGSAVYWHHDLVYGPRMFAEAIPAWCMLLLLSVSRLVQGDSAVRKGSRRWIGEAVVIVVLVALGYGAAVGAPERVSRLGTRIAPRPQVPDEAPSLVFVHEPWGDRVGARLAARGMRLDSVRVLLTSYHPCQLEAALAGTEVEEVNELCGFEAASDSLGWLGLTDYLWQDDLPGLDGGAGVLWARDLGPEPNARLIEAYPGRVPRIVVPDRQGGGVTVPYDVGMDLLWGGAR